MQGPRLDRWAGHSTDMTRLSATAAELAQGARPDGPPWLKWTFLAVWLVLTPTIIYKLYQHGYFRKRR
ncbi:hypothetical protein GCM10018789_64960 [Streptomyces werraensis]|nr:hypothetical protein GCM10018789_64960 [Streptomyces werraensis]